uniref:Uncharacterized protein n=1 Tax=Rhodopseudomonas palustris (strain BisA53) TaxID=316055 RepID=Q07QE6_RHOP5
MTAGSRATANRLDEGEARTEIAKEVGVADCPELASIDSNYLHERTPMPNVLRFPNPSQSVPQATDEADKSIAHLVDGASRLIGESKRCRELVVRAFEQLDASERLAAEVTDEATSSTLVGIVAERRKCLALLDQTLAAELQSLHSLSSEIEWDEGGDAAIDAGDSKDAAPGR